MRLIDADRLCDEVRKMVDEYSCFTDCKIAGLILKAPTIHERHGHWMFDKCLNGYAQCSKCKRFTGKWDDDNADNYCSHCGTKMDG